MAAAATAGSRISTSGKIEERVVELIKAIEADKGKPVTPFNRIILRFPLMAKTLGAIKSIFDAADTDASGAVEYGELVTIMSELGATMNEAELTEVFHAADMYDDKKLSFREFLVGLALGSLLGLVPFTAATSDEKPAGLRTAGEKHVKLSAAEVVTSLKEKDGRAVMQTFHLFLEAYVTFDRRHTGILRRQEIEEAMLELTTAGATDGVGDRKQHPVPTEALAFLSEERFKELDFDDDGKCTFAEFVYAMTSWVGIEDPDEEGEEAAE